VVENSYDSIVSFQAHVPEEKHSSKVLGTLRHGTGIVINPQGYILTAGYLVMEASEIQVRLADDQLVEAEVTGVDYESGLGLIHLLDAADLRPISLGNASRVSQNQLTLTIGDSLESQSRIVTNGRIFEIAPFTGYWEYILERALYIIPQNPAFGGSPLFNLEGEVIGIISLQLNQNQGMNLAIPIETLYEIESELLRYGRVVSRRPRTWTGIYHAPLRPGVVVVDVMPDGPAAQAGIRKGDIITHVAGNRVRTEEQFLRQLWEIPVHSEFDVRILRHDVQQTIALVGMSFYEFYDLGGSEELPGH
jgi:S1-C subfamily serine protease